MPLAWHTAQLPPASQTQLSVLILLAGLSKDVEQTPAEFQGWSRGDLLSEMLTEAGPACIVTFVTLCPHPGEGQARAKSANGKGLLCPLRASTSTQLFFSKDTSLGEMIPTPGCGLEGTGCLLQCSC